MNLTLADVLRLSEACPGGRKGGGERYLMWFRRELVLSSCVRVLSARLVCVGRAGAGRAHPFHVFRGISSVLRTSVRRVGGGQQRSAVCARAAGFSPELMSCIVRA